VPRTDPLAAASPPPARLLDVLDEARAAGFLGPGPLDTQLRHAEGFAVVARSLWPDGPTPPVLLDLGSGGGLPGLVVAARWPEATVVLLDASARRTAFLAAATRRLELEDRVSVRQDRAEVAGRDPELRGRLDLVLARSFGRPAVTAECAAPLLKPGGWLVVSEPPAAPPPDPEPSVGPAATPTSPGAAEPSEGARWPAEPLRQLGLEPARLEHVGFDYQTLRQFEACPERFPRRDGVPAKRPLF
jgi:16S rRNA (guanine527-N7)-methyltransferase